MIIPVTFRDRETGDYVRAELNYEDGKATTTIVGRSKSYGRTPAAASHAISSFIGAVKRLWQEGAVSDEVFEYRKGVCQGVTNKNPRCGNLKILGDGRAICQGCGCGDRVMATLWGQGVPPWRLRMPDPKCPIGAIRPMPGMGSLEPLGGRLALTKAMTRAVKEELERLKVDSREVTKILSELRSVLLSSRL